MFRERLHLRLLQRLRFARCLSEMDWILKDRKIKLSQITYDKLTFLTILECHLSLCHYT